MYPTLFSLSLLKGFVKLLKYTVTMVMDGYDRNLTTFHRCWTKVFATHLYPHKIMAYDPFYERLSHNELVHELL